MWTTAKELMPGPTRWLPTAWAFQAPTDFALPSVVVSPEGLHNSILYRTATATMRSTRDEAYSFLTLFMAEAEPLLQSWRAWRLSAVALVLHRARTEFNETEGLVDARTQHPGLAHF